MPTYAAKILPLPKADALDAVLKARIEDALADQRPSEPQTKVSAGLRNHHETSRA